MIDKRTFPSAVTNRILKTLLLSAAVLIAAANPASASVITAFGGASGPGLDSMSFNNLGTPNAGNDDVVGDSPNWVAVNQKAFDAVDYIDMVFTVEDFGVPTTEYILTEGVFNGTGENWIGYQVMLGFGTGAGFVNSTLGDGLDFDSPDYNSTMDFAPFATVTFDEDTINSVDGLFVAGGFHVFTFAIDVPNGITEFTIRQTPRNQPVADSSTSWGQVKTLFR